MHEKKELQSILYTLWQRLEGCTVGIHIYLCYSLVDKRTCTLYDILMCCPDRQNNMVRKAFQCISESNSLGQSKRACFGLIHWTVNSQTHPPTRTHARACRGACKFIPLHNTYTFSCNSNTKCCMHYVRVNKELSVKQNFTQTFK